MSRLLLVDKSAFVRMGQQAPREEEELCLCAVTRLELLYSARSPTHHAVLEEALDAFRHLRMDAETFAVAISAEHQLAGSGRHRLPVPDLLVGACAHQHGADVLHVDRHFEVLGEVLGFRAVRLAHPA